MGDEASILQYKYRPCVGYDDRSILYGYGWSADPACKSKECRLRQGEEADGLSVRCCDHDLVLRVLRSSFI